MQTVLNFVVLTSDLCSTCIISIIRIRTLKDAAEAEDPNWDNVDAAYWSFLEVCTAVLAACLPTLRPVLAQVFPRAFESRQDSKMTPCNWPPETGNAGLGENRRMYLSTLYTQP